VEFAPEGLSVDAILLFAFLAMWIVIAHLNCSC
jgi:hypothetical protein